VGALLAWVAVGGDLLGSCIYGPDTLGRAVRDPAALLLVGGATILTLALLGAAYHRLNRRFLHGGGGYTAAKVLTGERLALVSGVALVLDAGVDVAISVVFCTEALAALAPAELHWLKLPLELLIVLALTAINVRGIRESARALAPILILFAATHLGLLGWAVLGRAGDVPPAVAAVPRELVRTAAELGALKLLGSLLLAFASSGAMYTGIECVSNAAPLLREPRERTSKRTMLLVAGVPAIIIAFLLLGYVLYGVGVEGDKTLNAVFFERVADRLGAEGPAMRVLLVGLPLVAEALLLVVAAQTGFSDGPRTLGALAGDRFMPRSLLRLNARLMPERGILLVGAVAFGTTLLVGGRLAPLVAIFVTCVFVTVTISQIAMLRDALAADTRRGRWTGVLIHGSALLLGLVILLGTVAANLGTVALAAPILIGGLTWLCGRVRRRHAAVQRALAQPESATNGMVARAAWRTAEPPLAEARWAVLLVGERLDLAVREYQWVRRHMPRLLGISFASVALVDAETIHGLARIREAEERRRGQLLELASRAARDGIQAEIEVRRGADLIASAAAMALDLVRGRPPPGLVVGCRLGLRGSRLDWFIRDDVATPIATRLERLGVPAVVLDIPVPGLSRRGPRD
jgi:amino acid transporter